MTHKDLTVWKVAIEMVTEIYALTNDFPEQEKFGLCNQIRRAAVSVPSNIAEGAARTYSKEFIQFLSVSLGSLAELETQLIISNNLKYINEEKFNLTINKIIEIRKMIIGLRKRVKSDL